MSQIKVKLVRSTIGQTQRTIRNVRALGLKKIGSEKTLKDNNCIRGIVNKIHHLVSYELVK